MENKVGSGNTFYCRNYVPDHHHIGTGIAAQELFPDKRKGCLDASILKKLGLNRNVLTSCDALFYTNYCYQSAIQKSQVLKMIQDRDITTKY